MTDEFLQEIGIHNQQSLEELAWAIEASQGEFALILARCNYLSLRSQLVEHLQTLCSVEIVSLTLPPSTTTLYACIRESLEQSQPDALMVLGLEAIAHLDQLLSALNSVREEFRKNFHFPVVLWVTDAVHKKLVRLAPDFESWATTTEFAIATDGLLAFLHQATNALFTTLLGPNSSCSFKRLLSTLDLSQLRRLELESCLRDLQNQGQAVDPTLQAGLDFFRGLSGNNPTESLDYLQRSLALWQAQEEPDPLKVALLLFYIGRCRYFIADQNKYRQQTWDSAIAPLQQAIALFEQANRPDLAAKCVTQLGRALRRLQRWDGLEQLAQKAVTWHQTYGTPSKLAQDYGFLTDVALYRQQWALAKQLAQQALEAMAQVPEEGQWEESVYLLHLAQAERSLGDTEAALSYLQKARKLGDQGHPRLYLRILQTLRDLYLAQKQYLQAFRIKQEQLSVEQQYGLRAFVGAGRIQPKREEANEVPIVSVSGSEMVAPEIVASGRQQDLERLVERIGRNDYRVIVLHGSSGVGKSSLVNAGFIPTLKAKTIGTRKNLTISIRRYNNWAAVLAEAFWAALAEVDCGIEQDANADLSDPAATVLQQLQANEQRHLRTILIFDQFEEFFFVHADPANRRLFYEFLGNCLTVPTVKIVLSLREDYIHYLLECSHLPQIAAFGIDLLSQSVRYELGNFSQSEAEAILRELTDRARFYPEDNLITMLAHDLSGNLGQVRPIELQIVGAQLQTENITSLADYLKLGANPKEVLVERYLEEVVRDCGPENQQVAELLLYLLTDERGTRPLKTRPELERELAAFDVGLTSSADTLDLILRILCGSGLVVYLPETPDDRYQLVHDYLAGFIRQQQEPRLSELAAKLEQEKTLRSLTESELLKAVERLETSLENSQVLADSLAAEALLNSNLDLEALIKAMTLGKRLQRSHRIEPDNQVRAIAAIRHIVYGVHERNRLQGHRDSVLSVSFSPDGQRLASCGDDHTVRLWSLEGRSLKILTGHRESVLSISFSPDGSLIASSSEDTTIKLWTVDGQELRTFKGHKGIVWSVSFSPDGTLIASASDDHTVKLWSLDGKELQTFKKHQGGVRSVSFSPDGTLIASGSTDTTVKLWSLEGQELQTFKGHRSKIWQVSFSPDGQTLASASDDTTIKLWTLAGQELQTLKGHADGVRTVSFSPDGQAIASGSADTTIKLWSLTGQALQTFRGHGARIWSVNFSPDGQMLVSGSADSVVKLWSLKGQDGQSFDAHEANIWDVTCSPDSQIIASASADGTVGLWRLNGEKLHTLRHGGSILSVSFSPDGQYLVSGSADATVKLWNLEGEALQTFRGHSNGVRSVSFSPTGQMIASASFDRTIRLWSLDGQELQTLVGHEASVKSVSFSPDGQWLASASEDHTIKLWNFQGQLVRTLQGHSAKVMSVSFSPDSQMIASASADTTIKLWAVTGQELQTLRGHSNWVRSVSFRADGKTIASASADNTVKLWSVQGQELQTIRGHSARVWSVSFSPDGKYLISAGEDNLIKLWNFDLKALLLKGCEWLQDYLLTNPTVEERDRSLCEI